MTNENRTLEEIIRSAAAKRPGELPVDPDVKLPADVQASIARGEAAFREQKKTRPGKAASPRPASSFWTAVVDQPVYEHRESVLEKKAQASRGKRGQPPMLEHLRVAALIVDRLRTEGVPFATCRNSKMNKLVMARLNELAAKSRDSRKSRRKQISADAVQDLLRKIKALDD